MLKGFVSGEEKDIKRIPMVGRNLWDEDYTGISGSIKYVQIPVGNGRFTLSTTAPMQGETSAALFLLAGNVSSGASGSAKVYSGNPLTVTAIDGYVTVAFRSLTTVNPADYDTMLNLGSTPLPYEPYGYQEGWEVRDNEDRILWGREDELQTATGTLPFKGYSLPLKTKSLLGNAVQNGTPAPDNIIMPEMCGVRTGNLFDYAEYAGTYMANAGLWEYVGTTGTVFRIPCTENTAYTLSLSKSFSLSVYRIATVNTDSVPTLNNPIEVNDIVRKTSAIDSYSFTTPAGAKYILFQVNASTASEVAAATMLNLGSTALPYEPYGWKIPFENHGENLFDESIFDLLPVSATASRKGTNLGILAQGTYTFNAVSTASATPIYRTIKNGSTYTFEAINSLPYTFIADGVSEQIIRTSGAQGNAWTDVGYSNIMLTPGSEAKPYSPYLNETIPVYLGEVPTVRRVKKLVLTGKETFVKNDEQDIRYLYYANRATIFPNSIGRTPVLCNELPVTSSAPQSGIGVNTDNAFSVVYFNFGADIMNAQPSRNTVAGLKEYLAAKYAAGHPVTIWYVLNTEETTISNEPLCKISTYADELTTIQVHGLSAPLYGIGDYKDVLNLATGVVTRKVKKVVLAGTESWNEGTSNYYIFINVSGRGKGIHNSTALSTHTESGVVVNNNGTALFFKKSVFVHSSLADFKSYLAAQYAAGTPVTVWYVLETPTTETVTVPTGMTGEIEGYLTPVSTPTPTNRSVPKWNGVEETGGTYAVTVYTPPEIPTTTGQNTLTVDTTLAPSSLTVKGHIKELT